MKIFIISILLIFIISIYQIKSQDQLVDQNEATIIDPAQVQNNTNSTNYFLDEILEKYAEYETLEEIPSYKTCNYETQIHDYKQEYVLDKIKLANCIPDSKTFSLSLEIGYHELAKYLVKELYLPKFIDPTQTLYSYINQNEGKLNSIKTFVESLQMATKLNLDYTFENFDNSIKFYITLPDPTYVLEYFTVFCYKDMFCINAIFKHKNKVFKINDNKLLYDLIEAECENTYNYFEYRFEISFNKVSKFKKWEKLFKTK